jgi:phosphatidylglycerophosphate synthase
VGNLNDFADLERGRQQAFAEARTRWMGKWVKPLRRIGVTADHITLAGLSLLIPYAWFFQSHPIWATGFLLASILVDGVDGVYARVTGTANDGGALTDVCADHVGMVLTVLLVIHHGLANAVAAAYYAVIYVTMVSLCVLQNYAGVPLQIVFRTKFPLYFLYAVWAFTGQNGFVWLFVVFSITMTFHVLQSFSRLKRHFSKSVSALSEEGTDHEVAPDSPLP